MNTYWVIFAIINAQTGLYLNNRAAIIRTSSSKQLTIAEFDWPFETALDKNNRWVKLSECIPWDELAESYYQGLPADATPRSEPDAGPIEEKPGDSPATTFEQTEPEATQAKHRSQLILDATVVEQAIRFPTDLSLLNEAHEFSDEIPF